MLGLAETSPVRWSSGNVPGAVRNGCFTIGPKIPVKLTITPPSSSLTALADPDWRMTLNPDWIAVPRQKKE